MSDRGPNLDQYWHETAKAMAHPAFHHSLAAAASVLQEVYTGGGIVVTVGNGGSASTASHFAADLAKFATRDRADLMALCLNDSISGVSAWTNDTSWSECYARPVATWLGGGGGLLCAFSVHGGSSNRSVSDNLCRAAEVAREHGNRVIAFTGFDGGRLAGLADILVNVGIDQEPLATPLIESIHVMAHHFLCLALRTQAVPA